MEQIIANVCLWKAGFIDTVYLNTKIASFEPEPWDIKLYEEIQEYLDQPEQLIRQFNEYYDENQYDFDEQSFKKVIIKGIWDRYTGRTDLAAFTAKCYSLWEMLPEKLEAKEPYYSLGMIDDYLRYGDEEGVISVIEKWDRY